MNHPLTDEICKDLIFRDNPYGNELQSFMRAAADWQLKQVIEQWEEVYHSIRTDTQVIREFYTRLHEMADRRTTNEPPTD